VARGIDRSQCETANDDLICVEVVMKLVNLKDSVIAFAKKVLLSSQQTRDDYCEV